MVGIAIGQVLATTASVGVLWWFLASGRAALRLRWHGAARRGSVR